MTRGTYMYMHVHTWLSMKPKPVHFPSLALSQYARFVLNKQYPTVKT